MKRYTVGVDVGGTNIKIGLVGRTGNIVARSNIATKKYHKHKARLIDALMDEIKKLIAAKGLTSKHISGIGVGLPGLIDNAKGIVGFLPNVPGWHNVPLKRIIQSKLRIPTYLDNDVNLVTLGEWKFGAGKDCANLICFTLGTGVGAGLVFNNCLYRGEGWVAGELGHVPLNEKGPKCTCGGWGCFERYVGNRVLQKKAERLFRKKNIQLPEVYALASRGNARAMKIWKEAGVHIGNALVGVINLLNPRMVIIGGGVANNIRFMSKPINEVINKRCMKVQAKMVKVVRAQLGDAAGIIGAQVLVKEAIGDK